MNQPAKQYIPQAAPFVLVTAILEATQERVVTSFTIPENHVLAQGSFLSESGLVENMAQTAAAGMGYLNRERNKPETGFIGALKNLQVFQLPPVGATIQTTITSRFRAPHASVVLGEVFWERQLIASCELNIFLQQE